MLGKSLIEISPMGFDQKYLTKGTLGACELSNSSENLGTRIHSSQDAYSSITIT